MEPQQPPANFIGGYVAVERAMASTGRLPQWPVLSDDELNGLLAAVQSDERGCDRLFHDAPRETLALSIRLDGKEVGTIAQPDLAALRAAATPAPFGHGNETVLDDSVRKAGQIEGRRLRFGATQADSSTDLDDELYRIVDLFNADVCEMMAPRAARLRYRLYKMHLYDTGGFFKPHRDTLHDNSHIGTVVVTLPVRHRGGTLVLRRDDLVPRTEVGAGGATTLPARTYEHRFDTKGEPVLGVCAFFTDTEHEVLPVTEGTRVVLQFDVYVCGYDVQLSEDIGPGAPHAGDSARPDGGRGVILEAEWYDSSVLTGDAGTLPEAWHLDDASSGSENSADDYSPRAVASPLHPAHERLLTVLRRRLGADADDDEGCYALLLTHKYATSALRPAFLRGVDAILWDAIRHHGAGLAASLHSVLIEYHGTPNDASTQQIVMLPFDDEDIASVTKGEGGEHRKRSRKEKAPERYPPLVQVVLGAACGRAVYLGGDPYIEHTGNEAQEESRRYHAGVIVVERRPPVPPGSVAAAVPDAPAS